MRFVIKKKRLLWVGVIIAALIVGAVYGYGFALLCLLCLGVLLGLLQVMKVTRAHSGFAALVERRPRCEYPALITAARSRLGDADALSFVVLGDTRKRTRIARQVFTQAAADKPTLIFDTGDLVRHGTAREYVKHYLPLLAIAAPAPVFCIPGNHDRGARKDFAAFMALCGDDHFSLDLDPCLFVGFNNCKRTRVDHDDLAFLDKALASTAARHKFVFFHIPPRFFEERVGIPGKRRGFEDHAAELHALMVRHKVAEVFMGHIHGYATAVIDGVRYTLTAGAGAPLSKRLPPDQRVYHYFLVHVDPTGVRREVVRCVGGVWARSRE